MSNEEVMERLHEVFADVFGRDVRLSRETTAADVDGWDSLTQVTLLLAIETAFSVRFKLGEVERTQNIGDMADLLVAKLS